MRPFALLQRLLPVALSLGLLGLAVAAAVHTLPLGLKSPQAAAIVGADSSWRWRIVDPSVALPIFFFDDSFFPLQCGRAKPFVEHREFAQGPAPVQLALTAYHSANCPGAFPADLSLSLHPASLRLLWTLLPLDAREQLTRDAWNSARGLGLSIADAFDSQRYQELYRPELLAIVQDALQRVGTDPLLQERVINTIRELSPRYVGRVVDDLWPIAREQAGSKIWENLWSTAGSIIGRGKAGADGSLTAQILQAVIEDPRGQELAFAFALEVLAEPELAVLGNEISRAVIHEILRDPRFAALTDRLLLDPALFPDGHRIRIDLEFLVRTLPRQLLRYRHPKDHNPLVAYLARSIVRGDSRFVVLALTEPQRAQAEAQGIAEGIPLAHAKPVPVPQR